MQTLQIVLVLVSAVVASSAAFKCNLSLKNPKPIILKRFGSRTAIIKSTLDDIQLATNESMTLHCPTGFSSGNPVNFIDEATAELFCKSSGLYLNSVMSVDMLYSNRLSINCNSDFSSSLYESNISLSGCTEDAMTLLVGYRLQDILDVKILGICYDLSAMHLRFVSFPASTATNIIVEQQPESELSELNLDIYLGRLDKYLRFVTESEFKNMVRQPQLGDISDADIFQYASLLQEADQSSKLAEYKHMLNIVWLRSLRLGNWKHFLEALSDAHVDVDMRIGVSGVGTLPPAPNCNKTVPLQFAGRSKSSPVSLPVPRHIWAHVWSLQPTKNVHDEFVVVAHNSPYADILELSSFCADICSEIPWLRDTLFGQLHLVPSFGVMHCCRLDQLEGLSDFPRSIRKPPQPPPSPNPATTTTPSTVLL